jgi:hypothetical protein
MQCNATQTEKNWLRVYPFHKMHCDADRCGQIPSELEIIVSHILPYITTPDAVRVATLSGEIRKCVISGIRLLRTYFGSTRKSLLCTTTRDTLYIHHRFRSFEGLVGALVALGGSGLVIDSIEYVFRISDPSFHFQESHRSWFRRHMEYRTELGASLPLLNCESHSVSVCL